MLSTVWEVDVEVQTALAVVSSSVAVACTCCTRLEALTLPAEKRWSNEDPPNASVCAVVKPLVCLRSIVQHVHLSNILLGSDM
jgi:hypothetical protein